MKPVSDKVDMQIFYSLVEQENNLAYYILLNDLNSIWDILFNINDLLKEETYKLY